MSLLDGLSLIAGALVTIWILWFVHRETVREIGPPDAKLIASGECLDTWLGRGKDLELRALALANDATVLAMELRSAGAARVELIRRLLTEYEDLPCGSVQIKRRDS